jgi:hypothetical protein
LNSGGQARFFEYGTPNYEWTLFTYPSPLTRINVAHPNIFQTVDASFDEDLTQWNHYVITYEATQTKLYVNNVLLGTATLDLATISDNNQFRIGSIYSGFDGAIDDLLIFNFAITEKDVEDLYNGIITSTNNISAKTTLNIYPNPAQDFINVSEFSEIFNLSGTKVTDGKNRIEINHLAPGIYIVKSLSGNAKFIKQ